MYDTHDTIAAIASPAGPAARGIVRISGPNVFRAVASCFQSADGAPLDTHRRAATVAGAITIDVDLPAPGEKRTLTIPCDLFLWPGKRSYTRQPLAELHTLGSPPLLNAVLQALCERGARLAEPGEFTLRAFLGGRLDLTQAEAVLGVIDAHDDNDFSAALAQLAGGLAQPLTHLRDDLLQLLAELEAGLDFVDDDIEFVSSHEIESRLAQASEAVASVAGQLSGRETSNRVECIALVGPPNAGKSSLFNALATRYRPPGVAATDRAEQAIVSPVSGTTRDYLSVRIRLGEIECDLIDTAGVDSFGASQMAIATELSNIESAAQSQAATQRDQATLRVVCIDGASPQAGMKYMEAIGSLMSSRNFVLLTKADLATPQLPASILDPTFSVSSMTGQGLGELANALQLRLQSTSAVGKTQVVTATAERCRESVRLATTALTQAREIVAQDGGDELIAGELRVAIHELGRVVGTVYTDDLLDRIFSTFCIGK